MRTIEVVLTRGRRKYSGPSGWNELKKPSLYRKLYRLSRIGFHIPTTRFMALRLVYRMPERVSKLFFAPKTVSPTAEGSLLDDSDRTVLIGHQLLDTVQWIWDRFPNRRWHYKTLWVLWKRFQGPDDEFRGMTFQQFMFAERHFEETLKPERYRQGVLMLAATLYVPRGRAFDPERIARHARWLRWVPGDLLEAIAHNYIGIRYQFTLDFPEVFESDPDDDENKVRKVRSATSAGWLDVALSLVGENIPLLHEYEKEELWMVMKVLQNAMIRNKELAEQNKK
ncbi:hypothetical protein [Telluribacter humicola]|uniref:hypothetical protein n=1 Tax=Telluribacter humicola TaxID=1720261 RepID=UPI001A9772CC|nr:hypothetical protein [Telluribacter humicola]